MSRRINTCHQCNGLRDYNGRWDSFYCPSCRIWLESPCNCPPEDCEFVGRPEVPPMTGDEMVEFLKLKDTMGFY